MMPESVHQPGSAAALSQGEKGTDGRSHSTLRTPHSAYKWAVVLLPLAYLWFRLINNLWPEWMTNPQYGYGLLVPLLCLGLLVRRWHAVRTTGTQTTGLLTTDCGQLSVVNGQKSVVSSPWSVVVLFGILALLYLPTRLIEAATPEWRPIQWLLGVEAIGLTLCVIELGRGRGWRRQLAFPILFFFVAIPWPSLVEQPIIQNLTRLSAAIVTEALGLLGIPAMAHGNVIEVATGVVGIDEACSGIRSFQSSLMISLFLGEFYRLISWRRWLLIPIGFVLSMTFNVCRMMWLTIVAAKKGVAAISEYHDPAGITITILCTLVLWGLAWLLLKRQRAEEKRGEASACAKLRRDRESGSPEAVVSSQSSVVSRPWSVVRGLAISLLIWLVLVETGVQQWYRHLESHLKIGPRWSMVFPESNLTFRTIPIGKKEKYLLRFDEGKQGEWQEAGGTQWQVFYCSWLPGRVAGYLAKRHTPEICLEATGVKMVAGPELNLMNVHGVELPVRSYLFKTAGGPLNVFHCRWEAGVDNSAYIEHESARFNLIRGIWAGRGTHGQKVFEIILTGIDDPAMARAAMVRQLEELIAVEKPGTNL
jgi:exosortase